MNQYIICRVSNQHFTVSIMETNRIVPLKGVISVPDTPEYIMGIMETEGEVLPVIDLSERFFNHPIADESMAQVIIVYWQGKEVGLAVNEVLSIQTFTAAQIDTQMDKLTRFTDGSDYTPIKSFIRSEVGLILEIDTDSLFKIKGAIEVQNLMDGYEQMQEEETKELVDSE